jgi:hypothetical protein
LQKTRLFSLHILPPQLNRLFCCLSCCAHISFHRCLSSSSCLILPPFESFPYFSVPLLMPIPCIHLISLRNHFLLQKTSARVLYLYTPAFILYNELHKRQDILLLSPRFAAPSKSADVSARVPPMYDEGLPPLLYEDVAQVLFRCPSLALHLYLLALTCVNICVLRAATCKRFAICAYSEHCFFLFLVFAKRKAEILRAAEEGKGKLSLSCTSKT